MKSYIIFCNGEEYHDANDVVVRIMLKECDDPRYADEYGDAFVDVDLIDIITPDLMRSAKEKMNV